MQELKYPPKSPCSGVPYLTIRVFCCVQQEVKPSLYQGSKFLHRWTFKDRTKCKSSCLTTMPIWFCDVTLNKRHHKRHNRITNSSSNEPKACPTTHGNVPYIIILILIFLLL
ncbi:Os05g0353450 [Oryza sativa Japonica Group]|uniref:Os05g0353450 protein n=1 Tax=Oryza sativa subsp. japonica TaxID=39947 RepID=A0A0N7KKL5_ORYSJ|nr:hypothetical protein EE612_028871 [Oryza sativa]BAS93553.1 Os05g0353450 [Oryza sativa Japonica Group]